MSEIEQFYADKCIFLTGGTGFLGKILIEKLLRSCSRLKKIYVLIRPNSSSNPQKRLNDLFSCEVFKQIRENQPYLLTKVEPINGNVTYPGLGISYDCLIKLKREVHIVLHSAATIRFDEPLKKALEINLCGTEGVLNFCNQLDNLIVSYLVLFCVNLFYTVCFRTVKPLNGLKNDCVKRVTIPSFQTAV